MMLEPHGEVGANFSLQLSSRTQFTKINNKKVFAENQCEKQKKIEFTVKQLYLFTYKHILFQAKFCMLIVISLKNIEKMFFITKFSYVDFKMGSKVIKCNNRSIFPNCVSFYLWSNNKMLFKL